MSWSVVSSGGRRRFVVGHTDLDGIARAAAIKATAWSDAIPVILYSRKIPGTMPNTLAEALRTWLRERIPAGSVVLFEDIPVDVTNPAQYIDALVEFAKDREVVWTDHHETDAPFLARMQEGVKAIWFGPSAYEYTLALIQWLEGDVSKAEDYAILSGFGDRDPHVIRISESKKIIVSLWQRRADGMDVIIREVSSQNDPAEYGELVERMATSLRSVLFEAERRANLIPEPRDLVRYGSRVVLVREELPSAWGPKSLERAALKTGALYAIGVSRNPRDNTYAVRAITYWVTMATDPDAAEIGRLPAFQQFLSSEGRRAYGPPAAPVVPGYTTFEGAMRAAERLAAMVSEGFYEPRVVNLISDRAVARALSSDLSTILKTLTEILDEQRKLYREYLKLKEEQVRLLRSAEERDRRRYD